MLSQNKKKKIIQRRKESLPINFFSPIFFFKETLQSTLNKKKKWNRTNVFDTFPWQEEEQFRVFSALRKHNWSPFSEREESVVSLWNEIRQLIQHSYKSDPSFILFCYPIVCTSALNCLLMCSTDAATVNGNEHPFRALSKEQLP